MRADSEKGEEVNIMRLTWKDGLATGLTAAAVAVFWAWQAGLSLPLIGGVRGAATAILLIGVATCAVGSRADQRGMLSTALGLLGTVAGFAGLIAIIWASQAALAVEISVIVGLWAATTVRHALTPVPTPPAAERQTRQPPREPTHVG
jgi:hypothetical protein